MFPSEQDRYEFLPIAGVDQKLLEAIDTKNPEEVDWFYKYFHARLRANSFDARNTTDKWRRHAFEDVGKDENDMYLMDYHANAAAVLRLRGELYEIIDFLMKLYEQFEDNKISLLAHDFRLVLDKDWSWTANHLRELMAKYEALMRTFEPKDLKGPFPHYPGLNMLRKRYDWDAVFRPRKLCQVADTNGNFPCFIENLTSFKPALIRETEDGFEWIGGDSVLILTGDILMDRRGQGLQILAFLHDLRPQIEAAGGRLHVLMGNHDEMLIAYLRRWKGLIEQVDPVSLKMLPNRVDSHEFWSRINPNAFDLNELAGMLPDAFELDELDVHPEWAEELFQAFLKDEEGWKAWQEISKMQLIHRELDCLYTHAPLGGRNGSVICPWEMRPEAMNGVTAWALRDSLPESVSRDYFEPARLACMGLRHRRHLSHGVLDPMADPILKARREKHARMLVNNGINAHFSGHEVVWPNKSEKHVNDAFLFNVKTGLRVYGVDRGFGREDYDEPDDLRSIAAVSAFDGDVVWAIEMS